MKYVIDYITESDGEAIAFTMKGTAEQVLAHMIIAKAMHFTSFIDFRVSIETQDGEKGLSNSDLHKQTEQLETECEIHEAM